MNIPQDCHFAYVVLHEAWFGWSGGEPQIMIQASARGTGGGAAWEFAVIEDRWGLHLQMYDDSWAAFTQIPEFFEALASEEPSTFTALRALLDRLGAIDETPRVDPDEATSA